MTNPLRRPTFAWFFAGRLTSLLGSSMAPIALTFGVLEAGHRPTDLGAVLTANVVAHLAMLLIGGAAADRLPWRTVLITANVGSAVTQGAVALLLLSGGYSLPLLVGLEFANGALTAFTTPALRGLVPDLVGADQLQRANALLASSRNAAKIVGPAAAGLLIAGIGSAPAIAIDAASFLVSAACLWRIGPLGAIAHRGTSMVGEVREGWSYFWSQGWLWPVATAFCVLNLCVVGPWQVLAPQLVAADGGTQAWGLLLGARAVGMLATSLLLYRFSIQHPLRATLCGGAVSGFGLLGVGLGLPLVALLPVVLIGGAGMSFSGVTWDMALQQHVARARISRVAAIDDLLSYLAIPVGQSAVGPAAAAFGAQQICLVAAIVSMVAVTVPLSCRSVRNLRASGPDLVESAEGQ
jgi:MFS family permease